MRANLRLISNTAQPESTDSSSQSWLKEIRGTFKEAGLKGVFRRYGWKVFAAFFMYYLVRDITLYILIPYLITKHFIS